MRKFYQSVDLRSRKAMTDFLVHHFRYPTMNSWNGSYSYACNLKIYKLGLDQEIADKLYEMLDIPEELFTPMFAVSRIAGWWADRIEELSTGKRIMRPAYRALPVNQHYVPLDQR